MHSDLNLNSLTQSVNRKLHLLQQAKSKFRRKALLGKLREAEYRRLNFALDSFIKKNEYPTPD